MAGKVHSLLRDLVEDEILSSDGDSLHSGASDVEVDVLCDPMAPLFHGGYLWAQRAPGMIIGRVISAKWCGIFMCTLFLLRWSALFGEVRDIGGSGLFGARV